MFLHIISAHTFLLEHNSYLTYTQQLADLIPKLRMQIVRTTRYPRELSHQCPFQQESRTHLPSRGRPSLWRPLAQLG